MIKYFPILLCLVSSSSFAISKCLNEVKLVCPKHAEQTTCLKQNMARLSPECTETAKALIGTEEKVETPPAKATPPAVVTTTTVPKAILPPATPPQAPATPPPAAAAPAAPAAKKTAPEDACKKEQTALCETATAETMNECLVSHNDQLSPACRATLTFPKPAKTGAGSGASAAGAENAKKACAIEVQKLCPDTGGDHQKKLECLNAHQAEISPDCKMFGDPAN